MFGIFLVIALLLISNLSLVSSLSIIGKHAVEFKFLKIWQDFFMAQDMIHLGNGHLKRMYILLLGRVF